VEAWLVAVACEGSLGGARHEVRLPAEGGVLGREPGLALALPDPSLSLRHARIAPGPQPEGLCVEDLGSRHGTRLNGRRLEPGVAVPLRAGDELELGAYRVRLWVGDRLALPAAGAQAAALVGRLLAPDPPRGRLVVVDGPAAGAGAALVEGAELRLGRGPGCDLRLRDPRVSRLHAAVRRHGGRVLVRDLDSANGLKVAGRPVRGEAVLAPGESLELGASRLRLEAEPAPLSGDSGLFTPQPRAAPGRPPAVPWLLAVALLSAGLALWGG